MHPSCKDHCLLYCSAQGPKAVNKEQQESGKWLLCLEAFLNSFSFAKVVELQQMSQLLWRRQSPLNPTLLDGISHTLPRIHSGTLLCCCPHWRFWSHRSPFCSMSLQSSELCSGASLCLFSSFVTSEHLDRCPSSILLTVSRVWDVFSQATSRYLGHEYYGSKSSLLVFCGIRACFTAKGHVPRPPETRGPWGTQVMVVRRARCKPGPVTHLGPLFISFLCYHRGKWRSGYISLLWGDRADFVKIWCH